MPRRLTHEEASERLLTLGYEALEEYPGSMSLWRAKHLECGQEVKVSLAPLQRGHTPRGSCPCAEAKRADAETRSRNTSIEGRADSAAATMVEAGWEPLEPYPGSHKPWRCRCVDCGTEGTPSHHNVLGSAGRSKLCNTCSGRGPVTEEKARAVMLTAGWQPLEPYPGLLAKWACACVECGHEALPNYTDTKQGRSRCGKCSSRAAGLKVREDFEPSARQVMQDLDLEPLEPYPGAYVPWQCRCLRCGSLVGPTYSNAANYGVRGCWTCGGPARIAAIKAGKAAEAEARVRAAGYIPLEPYPGSIVRWACICSCGRETAVLSGAIGEGIRGCRSCAVSGFKPELPAVAYLIIHERLGAIKIGITAPGSERLKAFRRAGWELVHLEAFQTGHPAMALEREILDWWRCELSLPAWLSPEDMPQNGATETAELEMMPPYLARERMRGIAEVLRSDTRNANPETATAP